MKWTGPVKDWPLNCETENSTTNNHKKYKLCTKKNQTTDVLPSVEAKKESQRIPCPKRTSTSIWNGGFAVRTSLAPCPTR